jgi:pyruvate dehydrogenase E2 component (dihydrolipoamide acetyltransferase)
MKLIAGISSTIALLSLLTWNNHAVTAFVPSPTSSIYYSSSSTLLSATPIKITMPALSSTMKEGRVVSWLKSEGDAIEAGEAIMVVESDKADMDVEAFEDGFLAKILTGEGETAEVGAVVALVAGSEEEIAEVASGDGGEVAASAAVEAPAAAAAAEPAQGGELFCMVVIISLSWF